MKFKKRTAFMIDFISDYINGEIERYFFDLDYSAYVIKHFPHMEREDALLADKFAFTIDSAYEDGSDLDLSDEEFKVKISNAFDEWLDK
ncbi:MAG: hypothetical protein WC996_08530 [Peptostreptococcales bacterium]